MEPARAAHLKDGPVGLPDGDFILVEWTDSGGTSGPGRPIVPTHVHHHDDEAWYVLEGRLGFRLGEATVEAGPGQIVLAARGTPHAWWNAGAGPARYVLVMTPRIHHLVETLHAPGATDFAAIFREHDSELL